LYHHHEPSQVKEVLKQFGMEDSKSIATPLNTKGRLLKLNNKEYDVDGQWIWDVPY
jgi:hypothetical protein